MLIKYSGYDSFLGFVKSKESCIKKLRHHGKIVAHGWKHLLRVGIKILKIEIFIFKNIISLMRVYNSMKHTHIRMCTPIYIYIGTDGVRLIQPVGSIRCPIPWDLTTNPQDWKDKSWECLEFEVFIYSFLSTIP